jgi:hypothetical protein
MSEQSDKSFEQLGKEAKVGLIADFMSFMGENKKWWLLPFLIVFGLLAVLIVFAGTGAFPFLYTMF